MKNALIKFRHQGCTVRGSSDAEFIGKVIKITETQATDVANKLCRMLKRKEIIRQKLTESS